MKRFVGLLFFMLLFVYATIANAQVIAKDHLYAVKDGDSLYLTRYYLEHLSLDEPQTTPAIIFAFGGGFFTGERNNKEYKDFFDYYASNGWQVITIDYRLGLRPYYLKFMEAAKSGEKIKTKPKQMVSAIINAVNMAASDMITATNFVIKNANEWSIDTSKIIISGSSAGAITSLQTEYYNSNKYFGGNVKIDNRLPDNFRYAGVISFAGAVLSEKGKPSFGKDAAPILFFHGNADSNVPYKKVSTPWGGFYGPEILTKSLYENNSPYYLFTFNNKNHVIAVSPMDNNRDAINEFLNEYVIKRKQLMQNRIETVIGEPNVNKKFTVKDYIKSNFKN